MGTTSTIELPSVTIRELRAIVHDVAVETVSALRLEVTEYGSDALGADTTDVIEASVELALKTFLTIATQHGSTSRDLTPARDAAYALGRGEARAGRTMEALLAAYRIGAGVAWRRLSEVLLRRRTSGSTVAAFAQLVFAYIDELSGASVAGHRDELAVTGRVHEKNLERLAAGLLAGAPAAESTARAERAGWPIPVTLTAVVLRRPLAASTSLVLDPRTLRVDLADDHVALLVPDAHRNRTALLEALHGRGAIVGPTRPWREIHVSVHRAVRLLDHSGRTEATIDADAHLVRLVVSADGDALADLRTRALEPMSGLRPAVAARLAATLRSWMVHEGHRDRVAADLGVHPQTVRYRMNQIRELFGERLERTDDRVELVIALAWAAPGDAPAM